ncbi:type II secretion system protein [Candidatus Saccharibacteria bacterium CPR2]|nr:type II secretion system protein [Candidatus Saccharibacteria bacterium CPR2]
MKIFNQKGFTLVEILVVAPIFILVAMGMLGYLIERYGQTLIKSAEVNLMVDAQTITLNLEDELAFATNFGDTLGANLSDPNEPNGGWTFNTTPNTLIIYEQSRTGDIRDPNSDVIFAQPCDGTSIALNNLIYFSEDNNNNDYKSLYKRTVVPDSADICATNFRQLTCPSETVGTNGCNQADALVTDKLIDFQVTYYDEDNAVIDMGNGGNPLDAEKVAIAITLGDIAYGEEVQASSSLTVKKFN